MQQDIAWRECAWAERHQLHVIAGLFQKYGHIEYQPYLNGAAKRGTGQFQRPERAQAPGALALAPFALALPFAGLALPAQRASTAGATLRR